MNHHTQLPGALRFPGGYRVEVRIEERGTTCEKCFEAHGKQFAHLQNDDQGDYDTEEQIIRIWKGLTPRQRWKVLVHEYLHAWVDWQYWLEQQIT